MDRKRWANFPFHPGNWPFFYGWMILVWGSMGMLISIPGQTMGVSVFTDPLLSALDISRDQLSLAYMLGTIGSSFILPFAGRVFDRIGARFLAIVSSVGLGIILVFLSQIDVFLFDWLNITSSFAVILVLFSGFLFLRFFGQGVLTMSSRNMMAEWFEHRRGLATGFSNVFVSLGFSGAPVVLYQLIQWYDWKGAWLLLAFITGIVFPIIVFVFYRDRPEDSGLKPDGGYVVSEKKRKLLFPVIKEFSLREALANYSFWVLSLMLAMQGLYITGFTFHIVSIFDEAGFTEDQAITIFPPIAVIAVVVTLLASAVSDYIQLKYLLYLKGFGACIGVAGLLLLGETPIAYYLMVLGNGIMAGLFSVLITVSWPRYFGRTHLGSISSQAIMMIVFGSALGPILFSGSLSRFGSYDMASSTCLVIYLGLTVASFWANNPQKRFRKA